MSKYLYACLNELAKSSVIPSNEIKYKTQVGVCVAETLKNRGFIRAEKDQPDWSIYWAQKQSLESVYQNNRINKQQKINHFRSYHQICKKDNLNRNLKKHRRNLQRQGKALQAAQYNFMPTTYHLPLQYNLFTEDFKRMSLETQNIWIMKPVSKCQGKGIFLFNKLNQIQEWSQSTQAQPYIVQKYVENPLLIGCKKFDLRIYVLCTSYRPLNIYIYRSGFARFTHFRYDISSGKLSNNEIHLTNVAIQKNTSDYNSDNGGKWELHTLKLYLLSKYDIDKVNRCFYDMQLLIIKTLKSVAKIMSNEKTSFELYGFDILIESNLKPWLIEVNGSPSMRANTARDRQMKCGLIDDLLSILDFEGILSVIQNSQQLSQIGGFDKVCQNDVIKNQELFSKNQMSMLGCINDRQKNYRQLAKYVNSAINKKGTKNNSPAKQQQKNRSPQKTFSVRKQIMPKISINNRESVLQSPEKSQPLPKSISQNPEQQKNTDNSQSMSPSHSINPNSSKIILGKKKASNIIQEGSQLILPLNNSRGPLPISETLNMKNWMIKKNYRKGGLIAYSSQLKTPQQMSIKMSKTGSNLKQFINDELIRKK